MNNTTTAANSAKVYRVVQWATGRVGQSSMRAVIRHPGLELVGAYVHSAVKEGRDIGELCGLEPIGIAATRSIDDVIKLKPDCVLYMQEGVNVDDVCRLLEAGINIVTTRNEFFYPRTMDPSLRERTEAACKKGGASVHATGSSPGFVTEALPLVLTSMSRRLDCLTIDEFADIPASTTPDMIFNVMGFGRPAAGGFDQRMLDHMMQGFAQSLNVVADALSLSFDRFETSGEFAAANNTVEIPGGVIEKGTVAAQRISVTGMRDGRPLMRFRSNWYCSTDIEPGWDLRASGWRVVVEGDTPLDVHIGFLRTSEGMPEQMAGYTAHRAVNAVPFLCEAAPGIRTSVDLPQIIARLG